MTRPLPGEARFFTPLQTAVAVFIGAFFAAGYVFFHNRRAAGEGADARGALFFWITAGYGFLFLLPLFPFLFYVTPPLLCVYGYTSCKTRFFAEAEQPPRACPFIAAVAAGLAALGLYTALAYVTYRVINALFFAGA